ncbi:protein of unknown function [Nitrospira defluvii]|uniref:Uncharacterized protein n=1 Tax=Nitrospira defluvii TaxID=330214 RepID=D8P7H7_9BACT|nr:protein of unknown function [Nitrospira defluvii]
MHRASRNASSGQEAGHPDEPLPQNIRLQSAIQFGPPARAQVAPNSQEWSPARR